MKKIWFTIIILSLLSGCSSSEGSKRYKKHSNLNHKKFQRAENKFIYRVKPSESMQAGLPKATSSYNFLEDDGEDYQDEGEDSLRLANDDTNRLVDGSGNYRGYFKVGNPYEVFGVSYFPQNYEDYEEIGTASWYGDDFHGKLTANGEIYDMQSLTAAHPTLPLPSLVRVTNLRNGKSVIVRVNDRGPFAKERIIDVSERAAEILEFKGQGTTEVKIELLRNDTDEMLQRLKIKN